MRMPFAIFLTLAAVCAPQFARAQARPSHDEELLFENLNRERAAKDLAPLRWDETLAKAAHAHAERMSIERDVAHQYAGENDLEMRTIAAGARYKRVSENIGVGESAAELHDGWMHSAGHRANILDGSANSVGIAVIARGREIFAVEDFSEAIAKLTFEEQERKIAALLRALGLRTNPDPADARKICSVRGYIGSGRPKFEANFVTPDLSKLPDNLEREIRSSPYTAAAVGACAADELGRYRLAVILY
ncbi:MAG TPA: CAP domain-containing protein [Candidatus Acidoferrales bacterium]|nr:CAP domain-containing protein [Candidatus Acidoferrales bacterium]